MQTQPITTLITGASRGLGRALAFALAARGAHVVLVARDHQALAEVVADIRQVGGTAHGIVGDVGDKAAIHPIAQEAAALVGPIDLLIHNASTLGPTPLPLLLDTECEDFEQVLQVNLLGPFRLSKILVGSMLLRAAAGHASATPPAIRAVVHISSDAAVGAYPRWGAYGVSKAALDHLARTFSAELAEHGIHFLSLDPGEMNTQMHAEACPEADPTTLADPRTVASRIVALLHRLPTTPQPGAKLRYTAAELPRED